MLPWQMDTVSKSKHWKRKVEKQMKETGLTGHQEMFKMAKTRLSMLMAKLKADFYNNKMTN